MPVCYIDDDLVTLTREKKDPKTGKVTKERLVLAFGDPVEILGKNNGRTTVRAADPARRSFTGYVNGNLKTEATNKVLKLAMVDVQQGDGMVMETPSGQVVLIDGGDNKLFARYCAARFPGTSAKKPLDVAALIVTHGDADHFAGLIEIFKSESHDLKRKRLFIHPKRVLHNGLAKGPSSLADTKMFGATAQMADETYVVGLVENLLAVTRTLNRPFKGWIKALRRWAKHGPIAFHRIQWRDPAPFDFLTADGISVDVHGPITEDVTAGATSRPGLRFLRKPKGPALHNAPAVTTGSYSASHTVNGHSIAFRLNYGNVRFYFTGDMNQPSMRMLLDKVPASELQSEVLKAPHHGSADFYFKALKAMAPVVSLISSGDESSRKEHIHPRATLVGALGRVGRIDAPIVLCTELAAFFEVRGMSNSDRGRRHFGFERTNFGIIHLRTDGKRLLVFTHSGRENMKEVYRLEVSAAHKVTYAAPVWTK